MTKEENASLFEKCSPAQITFVGIFKSNSRNNNRGFYIIPVLIAYPGGISYAAKARGVGRGQRRKKTNPNKASNAKKASRRRRKTAATRRKTALF